MQTRRLGRTNLNPTVLGFGATTPAPGPQGEEQFRRAVRESVERGITLFDTAACYGESENWIGEELEAISGSHVTIVTKCGHHDVLADGRLRSRSISIQDVEGALRRLRRDTLDVMLLHSYDLDLLQRGDALAVLDTAKSQGKIRYLGYSGDGASAAFAANHPLVDVVEMSMSIVDQENLDSVLGIARANRVGVLAKRALGNAVWRPELRAGQPVYSRRWVAMQELFQGFGLAPGELALRFALGEPDVGCVLVGARSREHLVENQRIAGLGPLPKLIHEAVREEFRVCAARDGSWPAQN